jgi:NAD(P)-dependent dehydrogenase (short-subunit alcohol dehydrogenase family)
VNGLQDKVALVMGGASGVGRATSLRLASEGARVVVADLNDAGAASVAKQIRDSGGEAEGVRVDLRVPADIDSAVAFTVETYGRVELLHNVGFDGVHVVTKDLDILTTDMADYEEMLAVTLRGYVLACRAAIPHMIEAGHGAIVNTSSLAAIRSLGSGLRFSYSIAKSGLGPLSQHISVRYGKQGVRCNTVALGLVLSDTLQETVPPERKLQYTQSVLVPNPGVPEDIAAAVVFLLSDDARYITGQTINVDGGSSAKL